jgi:beta-ribofuranosylaminobenzene 5'-phosphate synthase
VNTSGQTGARADLAEGRLGFALGTWGIRVTAASRLSYTLIDLNGETGRRNGMASMAIRDPSFAAVVSAAEEQEIVTDDASRIHEDAIESFMAELRELVDGPPARVVVERGLPAHTGFGSKTTSLLALGKAYAAVCGRLVETEQLAKVARRGGTSGASVNLVDRGGFLVDGGHANPDDFDEDPQRYLIPSRFAGAPARKPPVLVNLPFPPWPILVLVTAGLELHGKPELDWFRETLPIPAEEARRTAHFVLLNLAPAIAEADYPAFCRALNRLTYEMHYKREQIAIQPEPVRQMFAEAADRPEVDAIGISVTGPGCFAFSRWPAAAVEWAEGLVEAGVVRSYGFTTAQNHPATIEAVPILESIR